MFLPKIPSVSVQERAKSELKGDALLVVFFLFTSSQPFRNCKPKRS